MSIYKPSDLESNCKILLQAKFAQSWLQKQVFNNLWLNKLNKMIGLLDILSKNIQIYWYKVLLWWKILQSYINVNIFDLAKDEKYKIRQQKTYVIRKLIILVKKK